MISPARVAYAQELLYSVVADGFPEPKTTNQPKPNEFRNYSTYAHHVANPALQGNVSYTLQNEIRCTLVYHLRPK